MTQNQIAKLYGTTKQNVSFHINNIFEDAELKVDSVVKDYLTTAKDGKKYFVTFYNLDMILAVGYRTRTSRAIYF
ncbi:MAG: virulence RhuM family protein [Bacilli bacterium]|nr:virulence RhuM family protein [Bacilli bacterium]